MTDLATLTKQGDVSIIKLDDGKANAFSLDMLESLNACLAEVPRDSGSLIITGRPVYVYLGVGYPNNAGAIWTAGKPKFRYGYLQSGLVTI